MIAAITEKPAPLPSKRPTPLPPLPLPHPGPKAWSNTPFGTFAYEKKESADGSYRGYAVKNAFDRSGKSFETAVRQAREASLESTTLDGGFKVNRAFAVLQSEKGVYYLAGLTSTAASGDQLKGRAITLDGEAFTRWYNSVDVTRTEPSLKAVVGSNVWVNFTDQKVDLDG